MFKIESRLVRKFFCFILEKNAIWLQVLLIPIEKIIAKQVGLSGIKKYPPVFIIGPPKSGTTLLYKTLTDRYRSAYISNFTVKYYLTPICGTILEKLLDIKHKKSSYVFDNGYISGCTAPHEAGKFWSRWFPDKYTHYVMKNELSAKSLEDLKMEIGGIAYSKSATVIMKTVNNSMRIAPLLEAIPETKFIVCERNHFENAVSIVSARKRNEGESESWWSVKPKEIYQLLDHDVTYQAVSQVYFVHSQIDSDIKKYGENKFLRISYEKLCDDAANTLNLIEEFINSEGTVLEPHGDVPDRFTIRKDNSLSTMERATISAAERDIKKNMEHEILLNSGIKNK